MEGINERLMDLINRSGFTQKEIAEKAGITEAAMSHYLKGTRCPRPTILAKFADILGTSVDYIIGSTNDSENAFNQIKMLAARNVSNLSDEEKFEIIKILMKNS